VTTVALVSDLMDRSRIAAALADVAFAGGPEGCAGADVVVVDLGGHAGAVASVRRSAPGARIVAFGRHDDPERLARARDDGADVALPRSRFFRDPAAATAASSS
jgi:DNA-binding NarL/FixJ family response regulator